MQWVLTKNVKKFKIKDGVVPHKFDCQKSVTIPCDRPAAKKRKHIEIISNALSQPSTSTDVEIHNRSETEEDNVDSIIKKQDKSCQVNIKPQYRSKGVNTVCNSKQLSSVATSPVKCCSTVDPTKLVNLPEIEETNDASKSDLEDSNDSSFELIDENYSSNDDELQQDEYKKLMLKATTMSIERNPKLFLGLPPRSFFLVGLLEKEAAVPRKNIYITLKKLRLNLSFAVLAIDFGMSVSNVSRLFKNSLHKLANVLQELIVWPNEREIKENLPIPFQARYGKLVSIIDCLEIEIEKPSDSVSQALTWSTYYNCNTIKYLISCTPDGLVSFVSEGFGGRASDLTITENCGYLKNIKPGSYIMADRGFKHVSSLLQKQGGTLVRPPSVSASQVPTKAEVKESKKIASLRIHVERVICRLREFRMLGPNASVDNHLVQLLDYAVITACGIINMQDHLIKTQV